MSHPDLIKSYFESLDNYDYVAERVVPYNKEIHEKILSEVSIWAPKDFDLVDLGIGPGDVDEKILEKYPGAHVTGIDISEKMLDSARLKLHKFSERAKLVKGDFDFADLGPERDFIISSIAIHNSADDDKMKLFDRIYDSLSDKGLFINADFIAGEDPQDDERDRRWYFHFLEQHLKGTELETWIMHAFYEDNPAKLSDQFKWLGESGFRKVECTWKKMNLAVYVAYK